MKLVELKNQIQHNTLHRWYAFTGPEVKVMDTYIQQIAKVKNATVQRLEDLHSLIGKTKAKSFVKTAHIYIVRDSKEFILEDSVKSLIERSSAFCDDCIIFIYDSIDKRSKFYKNYTDSIVEFEYLKMPILVRYIKQELDISEKYAKVLAEICEMDYNRCLLEIDKIKHYVESQKPNVIRNDVAFTSLLHDGTIYQPSYDAVFDFVDAVLKNKPKLSFRLLQESYDSGEATLVLISNLYNNTKQLLQVQSYSGDNLEESTGLSSFQIKMAKGRMNNWSNGDLVYLMRKLREAESGIKNGSIDEQFAMHYVLLCFWS